jgi:hypothetical protein
MQSIKTIACAAVVSIVLVGLTACGGDNGDAPEPDDRDDTPTASGSAPPARTRTTTPPASPTSRPTAVGRGSATSPTTTPSSAADTPSAGLPDGPYGTVAAITVTVEGRTFEFTGGRCTITSQGRILAIDITDGGNSVSFRAGSDPHIYTLQQDLDAGREVDLSLSLRSPGERWIAASGPSATLELADDLESGTFGGPTVKVDTGLAPEFSASFSC